MKKQTIKTAAILAVYAEIEHKKTMYEIVTREDLKSHYLTELYAMWQTLQIILGHEGMSETIALVQKLANENKAAA